MFKRIVACACTLTMVGTLMVGCSSSDDSSDSSTDTDTSADASADDSSSDSTEGQYAGVTVSVLMQQTRYYDGFVAMVDKLEEEEGIILDIQVVEDSNMDSVLQMQINSGEAPDIIDYNIPNIYGIVDPTEYLADLSDESWVENLIAPEVITYDDGNIYGFPLQSSSGVSGIVYNKDIFEEYGIEIPTTSAEFDAVCDQLLAEDITPVLVASDSWVPQIWMSSGYALAVGSEEECVSISDAVFSNQASLTDFPELIDVVDTYLGMFSSGYVNDDYLTISYDSVLEEIYYGEGAMMMGTSSILASIESLFEDANLGIFNIPFDYNEDDMLISQQFTIGFAATKDSENLEVVKYIFELWSTPEYLDLWFADQSGFPAFEGVDGGEINQDVIDLYDSYAETGNLVGEMNNYWTDIESLFSSTLWIYYLDAPGKGMTGEEMLAAFQEDITKYLTEMQFDGF